MPWSTPFDDPVPTPQGKPLKTLRDAGEYIRRLPAKTQKLAHWQTATAILIRAAEGRDFLMHARIAMLRALHHGKPEPDDAPRVKRSKAYRIIR